MAQLANVVGVQINKMEAKKLKSAKTVAIEAVKACNIKRFPLLYVIDDYSVCLPDKLI